MSGRRELPAPAVAGVVRWSTPHRVARATRRLYRGLYGCLETGTKRPRSELPLTSRDGGENTAASDGNGVLPERDVSKDWQRTARNVALGLAVGALMAVARGPERGIEYVTAYLVEQSLSVDNLFVFILLFRYFRVPRIAQEKALAYGIVGAGVFRGLFVFTGVALMEHFRAVTLAFGLLLLASAGRLLYASVRGEDADAERAHVDADDAQRAESLWVVRWLQRLWPVSGTYHGGRFFAADSDGKWTATPLFLVLLCIEFSDVVFALDSVPACLGISRDPLVVYISNMMAIVGLRSWFFVVEDALKNFRFLEQSLAAVLGFIGAKLCASNWGYEVNTFVSLGVVLGTLLGGYGLSVLLPAERDHER